MPKYLSAFGLLAQVGHPEGPGIWELFLDASPVGQFVLAVLTVFSLISWGIIISKALQLRRAASHTQRFLEIFRTSKRFSEVNSAAASHTASPLVGLFQAGYVEIDAQVKAAQQEGGDPSRYRIRSMNAIERTLRRALGVELHVLTRSTQFLATTAAASPFIGLLGTVWGIMEAFNDIGITGSTSITAVAPGIAEALINTAAGLGAAIPALIAYNAFSARSKRMREEMDDFVLEFINLTERNFT
ncbi:MAG TPA: MotA/TolQ/ExbB proton channel family protein [Thermoanaerobaculia bacterium]|nr:MotA/TolQ/ExbB proton channel family protein [Thermoanaerobaculia bacterium]